MLHTLISSTTNIFTSSVTSNDPVIGLLIYRIGLVVCIAAGHSKGKKYYSLPLLHYILNCFGGGITRDFIILNTKIWFFTPDASGDILFVLYGALLYALIIDHIKSDRIMAAINNIMSVLDAITVGSFIAIGFDKCYSLEPNNLSKAIISGYVTACWGGVTANFRRPTANLTKSNQYYHLAVILGSLLYCYHRNSYALCVFISIVMLNGEIDYRAIITCMLYKCIYSFSSINLNMQIRSFQAFFKNTTTRAQEFYCLKRVVRYPRVYLGFHRLRIC